MSKKIAVILSGCGYLDGAEIRESVLMLTALDALDAEVSIFAPNQNQYHVVNHVIGDEDIKNTRNVLEESARITRGKIENIDELNARDFSGLILPGGFGVAKNLCNWAFEGSECDVEQKVEEVIMNFYELKKPIGAICIAPALIARVLGKQKITVTIGDDKITSEEIEKTGAIHQVKAVDEICVDLSHKIVTTPGYMYDDARLHKIQKGIDLCVKQLMEMA